MDTVSIATKQCTACLKLKPLNQFSKSRERRHSHCNTCKNGRRYDPFYLPALKPSHGLCPLLWKLCCHCKEFRPLSDFGNPAHKRRPCKPCGAETRRKFWRQMSPESRNQRYRYHHAYMQTPNGQRLHHEAETRRNDDDERKAQRLLVMKETFMIRRYGITLATYLAMHEEQGGLCKICESPPSDGKDLGVDHCHATGKVRGLLCGRCNLAIGLLDDSITRLKSAQEYLRSHS